MFPSLPTLAELGTAWPVIVSLVMIEGLLSVDNAMGIAAMASNLPEHQQKPALRWGIIGAYVLRGVCLLLAGWIATNMWLKAVGAVYLLYLMASGLVGEEHDDEADAEGKPHAKRGFLMTIVAIEVMDLTLSLDNVVAAVALDKRMWVICVGVFAGILAMRFVAGYCIILMKRLPILEKTAFLLIGFVGVILCTELGLETKGIVYEITAIQKFIGIFAILAATIAYSETKLGKAAFTPVVVAGKPVVHAINWIAGALIFDPLKAYVLTLAKPFIRIFQIARKLMEDYNRTADLSAPADDGTAE